MSKKQFKNLAQCLQWMETQHPREIELGLARVNRVKELLKIEFKVPVIIVAGTNGKGTAVRAIETICLANDKKVGSLTSPHIFRFNERIKINQQPVDDKSIIEAVSLIAPYVEETPLTYFEICVLIALLILSRAEIDVVVLEVGLGGRLDAVNIIDADISVITHIGIDHVEFLGEDIEKIGLEKAGVMREQQITVLGSEVTQSVIQQAKKLNCYTFRLGDDFSVTEDLDFNWERENITFDQLHLHKDSVALAWVACAQLFKLNRKQTPLALAKAQLEGRFEIVSSLPLIIADVAHNPDAFQYLATRIKDQELFNITCIIGMCADKDITSCVSSLKPYVKTWCVCDIAVERGISSHKLVEILLSVGVRTPDIRIFDSPAQALRIKKAEYNQNSPLLITGSFYTVSEALTEGR